MPSPAGSGQPGEKARVFFAIWPDAAAGAALDQLARSLQQDYAGRRLPSQNFHLTLLFIGEVTSAQLAALAVAAQVATPAFRLSFDATECWPRQRLVCATARVIPAALLSLVAALRRQVQPLAGAWGVTLDMRPFRAHVTLLRQVRCPRAATPGGERHEVATPLATPIAWSVSHYALMRSVLLPQGACYSVVRDYALQRN